ncbi:MAG TPA: hypothetical protein PKX92_07635 [Edaphocola sp.]|nr:hypothetical protein [Edaphocola sp.]
MNKINENNIIDFIKYLYQENIGNAPSQEVLDSWTGLSDIEIDEYLQQLFENWKFSEEQIFQEINNFLNIQNNNQKIEEHQNGNQAENEDIPFDEYNDTDSDDAEQENHEAYTINNESNATEFPYQNKKSYTWFWFFLLIILGIGAFVVYKFQKFKNLKYLYVTTDNVSIRDINGNNIGRMDIFPTKNSVSFLRTTGPETFPITIKNKEYQNRQVLTDSTSFLDYLFNKKEAFAYVNENYVIDNKDNFIIYRNVFKAINNSKNENNNLTAKYRMVIVGSLKMKPELMDLFIVNSCNNNDNNYTSIVKSKTKNNTFQVIAQLSNGKYYIFSGQPDDNNFSAPQAFNYKVNGSDQYVNYENEELLFKKQNGVYFIYDCNKVAREYYVNIDNNGSLQFAKYSFDI